MLLSFREQIRESAQYLLERRNPKDGGWGLNIESGHQASSIVNTAESLYVIKVSGELDNHAERSIDFLSEALTTHPAERGDNLRYLTFGVLGLLQLGFSENDSLIQSTIEKIEKKYIKGKGWKETNTDSNVRIWPTFQSLWVLSKVYGTDYVRAKYNDCLSRILKIGRERSSAWGFILGETPSLAASSYVLILLSEIYPNTPDARAAHETVTKMLSQRITDRQPLEVEAISGTDWHHYSHCWGLKAIQYEKDKNGCLATESALRYIGKQYIHGRGYSEPGKPICNVRSIFNGVHAVHSVIESFDPGTLLMVEDERFQRAEPLVQNGVFLSYSFNNHDKELVEGLRKLLVQQGYVVITGEKNPIGSLSKTIKTKIASCEMFIVVMTCSDKKENGNFTTSSWLLEEKGAALALGKRCLMLVEEGIDAPDIGGLQGDDQRLMFNRNNFTGKVADALEMLRK